MDYLNLEQRSRRVVPNWRFYSETMFLGELESARKETLREDLYPIDEYVNTWLNQKSFSTAGDLISAAITNGQRHNKFAIDAARYVSEQDTTQYPVLARSADYLLQGNTFVNKGCSIRHQALIDKLRTAQDMSQRIREIRHQLNVYPYNAVLYADMARAQLSIGKRDKAIRLMQVALQLDPDNRFVVRAAVRLFHHLGDIERANSALRGTSLVKYDPWLIAADITTGMLRGKNSVHIKTGIRMIESLNYHPFSYTELASSLGTLEYYYGSRKKSRGYFRTSMKSPNDNSLAQAEWVSPYLNFQLDNKKEVKLDYEARFYQNVYKNDFESAANELVDWIIDMPYSQKPIYLGAHVSLTYLRNFNLAEEILKIGLKVSPTNQDFINNMAYTLARANKPSEAQEYIDRLLKIPEVEMAESMQVCLSATLGLIAYRSGDNERGRQLYGEAIAKAAKLKDKQPEVYFKAVINAKREALRASGYKDKEILKEIKQLEIPDGYNELKILVEEVLQLYEQNMIHLDSNNNK